MYRSETQGEMRKIQLRSCPRLGANVENVDEILVIDSEEIIDSTASKENTNQNPQVKSKIESIHQSLRRFCCCLNAQKNEDIDLNELGIKEETDNSLINKMNEKLKITNVDTTKQIREAKLDAIVENFSNILHKTYERIENLDSVFAQVGSNYKSRGSGQVSNAPSSSSSFY